MSVFVTPTTFKLNSMSEIIMIDKTDVAGSLAMSKRCNSLRKGSKAAAGKRR